MDFVERDETDFRHDFTVEQTLVFSPRLLARFGLALNMQVLECADFGHAGCFQPFALPLGNRVDRDRLFLFGFKLSVPPIGVIPIGNASPADSAF